MAMGEPSPEEARPDPDAVADPTGEKGLEPVPFLVQKHPDRVLVLAAHRCFFYCRFCFRRGLPGPRRAPGAGDWERILAWVAERPEVEEVILSGGDPLTLPDRTLAWVGKRLGRIPHLRRWRIHTRAPVVLPRRVGPGLIRALDPGLPCRVVLHANHPAELRPAVADAVARLRSAGIGVENQAVLLRGVNARGTTLAGLVGALEGLGVGFRYLHHPDRAPGTGRFRMGLARGLGVVREAEEILGRRLPYVLDLPTGHGKAPVATLAAVAEQRRGGRRRVRYRWTRPPGYRSAVPGDRAEWWDVWEASAR